MFRRLPGGGPAPAPLLAAALPLLLVILVACEPPEDRAASRGDASLVVSVSLESQPAISRSPLLVSFTEAGGQPVTGASVRVVGDMTHAGMQPVIVDATEVAPGSYRADEFAFTMAGDWIITVTATTADGRRVSGELFTNVPSR